MNVIGHDFGKRKRLAVRRFRQLLNLDALHEANIRENPLPYLERASERIFQLERALFDALEAAKPAFGKESCGQVIQVDKDEYMRLQKCRAILEHALAACRSEKEFG